VEAVWKQLTWDEEPALRRRLGPVVAATSPVQRMGRGEDRRSV
jgi:hypothetical protein